MLLVNLTIIVVRKKKKISLSFRRHTCKRCEWLVSN